ncbi:PiggyBac transposable element-derived protein 4 [Formica fusca]
MSYNRKKCVVLGCKSETLRLRSFPTAKDKERFLKWLRACGNTELLQLSVPQLRHRVVCDKHFGARVKLATTLSRVAVPTLHLPKPIDVSNYKFTDVQTSDAQKSNVQTTDKNSTNDEIAKILAELSESDVGGSEDEVSEEEHIFNAEQRHNDVEEDAAILSDSSDPNDRAAFNDSTEPVYVGRNNITTWNKLPCTSQSATVPSEEENITRPSLRHSEYEITDELSAFREIFDDGMLEEIVACTNFSIEHKHRLCSSHKNIKETTRAEMLAVIGLLYLAGMKRARHASLLELWTDDGTGLEICRSAMSYKRFLFLLDCLQLDDRNTRAMRLRMDRLAPIRNIWNKFVENCKKSYLPSESLAIGDRLKNFRGKCSFVQHVPNKPAHNGLKIISLVDVKTSYTCNMELYCDQQPEGLYRISNDPAAIVQRLIEHLKGSNSNLSCNEYYTSYLLAVSLLADKITFLGAMGKDHREVPLCFLAGKPRPVDSTRMGFRNDATLVSHVPQRGKAVIVLSTAHHDAKFNPQTKKPVIIEHYNAAKDAIDIVERTCAIYSVSKKTKRWPLTAFFVLLDVAGVNAQILYNASQSKFLQKYRRGFLKTLALALLKPHLQERAKIKTLPINIQTKLLQDQVDCDGDCQFDEQEFSKKRSREIDKEENLPRRKDRCFMCGLRKGMITTQKCEICSRFTCKRHIAYIKYICRRCDSIGVDKDNR